MNLTSMKMAPGADDGPTVASESKREYPYGLELSLDDAQLKALGLGMLAVGQEMTLHAKVKVTRCSQYQDEASEGAEASCSLQITDMALAPTAGTTPASSVLYGPPA